jgi:hypothetical protein
MNEFARRRSRFAPAPGGEILDLADTRRPMDAFWAAPAFERLRAVKATVDPDKLIRANHTIPPAR